MIRARLFLFMVLVGSVVAACQTQSPPAPLVNKMTYGQTVQGRLGDSERHWQFVGKPNDLISIDFSTSDSTGDPPPVAVLDPENNSVARLPNGVGRLQRFRLQADGQYTIAIGSGEGNYSLSLKTDTAASVPTPPPLPGTPTLEKAIKVGDSRLVSLGQSDASDLWSFDGLAGATISVQMQAYSGNINPKLRLYAPDGSLLTSDENTGGKRTALISGLKLPGTGKYLIQALGGGTGEYILAVTAGAMPTLTPVPTKTPASTAISTADNIPTVIPTAESGAQIRIGQSILGHLFDTQQVDHFAVFGPAGRVISIGMFGATDSSLVPAFEIYAPNGDEVASSSGATGAIVSGYRLPATGAYIVYAHGDKNQSSGPYLLTIGEGLTLRDLEMGTLTPNVPTQGSFVRAGDRGKWFVELPANATLSVDVMPSQENLDVTADLLGPDGKVIATAQMDPKTHGAKIAPLITSSSGRYTVRVSGKGLGVYVVTARQLRVEPTATFSVTLDQTIKAQVQQNDRYNYTFKAVPGMVVLIEVRSQIKNKFDPVIEFYGPSGRRLALADDASAENTDSVLQISLDDGIGAYTVQVHGYAMTPGTFSLHIKAE